MNPCEDDVVWRALERVTDPEIPVLNVVDLGIIAAVRIHGNHVEVDMTPTFAGCPALDVIREEIRQSVSEAMQHAVTVHVVYDPPWTSDRISEEGRRKLKAFGLSPPGPRCGSIPASLEKVACPFCESKDTRLDSIFGPTLCRSMHYCESCRQSFEHFKPV